MATVTDETPATPRRNRPWWRLPRIFITYRRSDSAGYVLDMRKRLQHYYGGRRVFQDTETIHAGEVFADSILRNLERCDVQLVVIGPEWATVTGADGKQRLEAEHDYVAGEIAHGLSRGDAITIIPVLVGEASFPEAGDLPPRIRGLLDHNARTLHDTRAEDFDQGMAELIDQIGPIGQRILGIPRIQFAIGSFVLAASVAAFTAVALQPPGPMGGETFNVAVAEFRTVDGSGKVISSPLAHRFTHAVAKRLSAATCSWPHASATGTRSSN